MYLLIEELKKDVIAGRPQRWLSWAHKPSQSAGQTSDCFPNALWIPSLRTLLVSTRSFLALSKCQRKEVSLQKDRDLPL
jgi:hypothetical protein